MKLYLLVILAVVLTACSSTGPLKNFRPADAPNACLADAISFYEQLPEHYWKKVLIVRWQRPTAAGIGGHAFCAFLWNGYVCLYDAERGSVRITRDLSIREDATAVAKLWSAQRGKDFMLAFYETR